MTARGPAPFAALLLCMMAWAPGVSGEEALPFARISAWSASTRVGVDGATLEISAEVRAARPGDEHYLRARLLWDGQDLPGAWVEVPVLAGIGRLTLHPPRPRLWTAESPHLYELRLELLAGAGVVDETGTPIGLREVSTRAGRLELNGVPIHLRGLRFSSSPDPEALRRAKALGANAILCANAAHTPELLSLADQLGLYVFVASRTLPWDGLRHACVLGALPPAYESEWADLAGGCPGGLVARWRQLEARPDFVGGFLADRHARDGDHWPSHWRVDLEAASEDYLPRKLAADGEGPLALELHWNGPAGEALLSLHLLEGSEPGELEVACDGRLAARVRLPGGTHTVEAPLMLGFSGGHRLLLSLLSGECRWDSLELRDSRSKTRWRLGRRDGSAQEFALRPPAALPPLLEGGLEAEIAAAYRPLAITPVTPLDERDFTWELELASRLDFTDLEVAESELAVQFFHDGRTWTQLFAGPEVSLAARATRRLTLRVGFLAGLEVRPAALEWRITGQDGQLLGRVGELLAPRAPVRAPVVEDFKLARRQSRIELSVGNAALVFDASLGALVEYRRGRATLLSGPVVAGLWRPARACRFPRGGAEIGPLTREPLLMEVEREREAMRFRFRVRYADAADARRTLMEGVEEYSVYPNGSFSLSGRWTWRGPETSLRRIGLDLPLSASLDTATWAGPGPHPTWRDAQAGARRAVHVQRRGSPWFSGNRSGVAWLHLANPRRGFGLSLIASPALDFDLVELPEETLVRAGLASGMGAPDPEIELRATPGQTFEVKFHVEGL